ncbi:MAG: Fic family protein [Hyphomicrobiaceae bacterium]
MAIANGNRHYDFLRSVVLAAVASGKPFISHNIIKALNYHAIVCLHTNPGEYRPWLVQVGDDFKPVQHFRVPDLMDDFINTVNVSLSSQDAVGLSAYVLWRLNHIHPFNNGNGRTARAACYFILCVTSGGWLRGAPILPELLVQNRDEYVAALKAADASLPSGGVDLADLHALLVRLLQQQMASTGAPPNMPATP